MKKMYAILIVVLFLAACSDPHNTRLPTDISKWDETIKPSQEKLTSDERTALADYYLRHTIEPSKGRPFGVKAEPIPEGMTIGKAIEEQRNILAKQQAKEALKEKMIKEREQVQKQIDSVLTVVLLDKKRAVDPHGINRGLNITLGFENNDSKDIAGIKGTGLFADMFGDTISENSLAYDKTITAGKSATWTGNINQFSTGYSKLKDAKPDKIKFKFIPERIVFTDGTKLVVLKDKD
jgi:hypothetical protein